MSESWLVKFSLEVPAPIRNTLVNLGLPVAGMDYRVEKDRVIFNDSLAVTKRGEFFWEGRKVTTRMFVNLAGLLTHYQSGAVERLMDVLDVGRVRVVNGKDVKVGRIVVRNAPSVITMPVMKVYNVELEFGYPVERVPGNVRLVEDVSGTEIDVVKGKLVVRIIIENIARVVEVSLAYRGVHVGEVEGGRDS